MVLLRVGFDISDAICKLKIMLFMMRLKVVYISSKPPLVGEHYFPLTGLVGFQTAYATFYTFLLKCCSHVFPRPRLESKLLDGESNVTMGSHVYNKLVQRTRCTCNGRCNRQIKNPVVCDASK